MKYKIWAVYQNSDRDLFCTCECMADAMDYLIRAKKWYAGANGVEKIAITH